ncbi:MAG: PQQ-binding-like beta-propeller repeat protein [Armatimonas sp.]
MERRRVCGALAVATVLATTLAWAEDSPQFRGADRTGLSKETGLLKTWPEGGPKLLWTSRNLGEGHATPSVARGKIFGMGLREEGEYVWALDEKTGKELWSTKIADGRQLDGQQGGNGSRCTPTIDGQNLYAMGVGGDLVCLSVADGKLLWQKSMVKDFGGNVPTWGYSESPLIDGDKVVVTPGGNGAAMVALKKQTGDTIWKSDFPEGGRVSYSSAIKADLDGTKQYVQFFADGVAGVSAADGKFLWNYAAPANRNGISCSMPVVKDGYVFASTEYNTGGGLAKIAGGKAEEVYFTKDLMNHHGGIVVVGDYLYGTSINKLVCLEFKTGKVVWESRNPGKGSLTYADGMLICRSERGDMTLVEANPKEYTEKGTFKQPERSRAPAWPYPVVANKRLYLRDQGNMFCYEIGEEKGPDK